VIRSPKPAPRPPLSLLATPQQLSIAFDSIRLQGMSPSERAKVLAHLASLLMLAAGAATEEHDHDER
jgi:hypothetical protein